MSCESDLWIRSFLVGIGKLHACWSSLLTRCDASGASQLFFCVMSAVNLIKVAAIRLTTTGSHLHLNKLHAPVIFLVALAVNFLSTPPLVRVLPHLPGLLLDQRTSQAAVFRFYRHHPTHPYPAVRAMSFTLATKNHSQCHKNTAVRGLHDSEEAQLQSP